MLFRSVVARCAARCGIVSLTLTPVAPWHAAQTSATFARPASMSGAARASRSMSSACASSSARLIGSTGRDYNAPVSVPPRTRAEEVALLAQLNRHFHQVVPHNQALGLQMVALEDGEARMCLPYSLDQIGRASCRERVLFAV